MLLITVTKDSIEDEMTLKLRSQAYTFAFIVGVLYALVQPLINFLVNTIVKIEDVSFALLSVDQVLFFMLLVQLAFFHFTKRMR
jgi:hypothetical protein